MNETTKKTIEGATVTTALTTSRFGAREPEMVIRLPKGTHYRRVHAALHMVAAEVNLATPASERWCVQTEVFGDEGGRVYLELSRATEGEAQRGLDLLRRIAA